MTRPETKRSDTDAPAMAFSERGAEAIRLLCGERRRVEVSAIRRSLADAMLAWPGEADERWWKWLVETGRALNYATRVIDATPQEVFELLRHGVAAVTLDRSSTAKLLVVTEVKRRKVRLCELPADTSGRWVSPQELTRLLRNSQAGSVQRWVVLDPISDDMPLAVSPGGAHAVDVSGGSHSGTEHHGTHDHGHPSPWQRLQMFMAPEWSDIWIVLVFALVIGMLTLATPITVEALVNTVAFGTLLQPLLVLSIILLTFLGFAASLRFLQKFVVELMQRRLFARVAARLAWQLPRVRLDQAHGFQPELLNRFFDVITMQKIVAQLLLDGLTVVLTVSLGMIILAFYHPWLLAVDAVLLLLLAFVVFVLGRGAVRTSIAESKSKYAVAGWLEDIARCPTMFKSAGAAELALSRTDLLTNDYLVSRQTHYRVLMRQIISALALEAVASAVLLGLGGLLVIQGQMTLGQLVAAELIVTLIVAAIAKFDKHLESFYDLLTSIDKLGHLFDLPVESSVGVMHVGRTGPAALSLRKAAVYFGDGHAELPFGSFDTSPGEVVAICGPAGSGKSTLFDVLFRIRELSSGRVLLDEFDLTDLRPDVLRQHVALVRGVEIIEGTLAENVHLHRAEISISEVRATLQRVGLSETARGIGEPGLDHSPPTGESDAGTTPEFHSRVFGLETELSYDGKPLSESQARRLMLARALVGKPRLLLIDGLLDSLNDQEAQQLIGELKKSRESMTTLVVTGRRDLAKQCDRIWSLPTA